MSERAKVIRLPRRCAYCNAWVEPQRRGYGIPVCFACLPPPLPFQIVSVLKRNPEGP